MTGNTAQGFDPSESYDVVIIGAGIIGSMVARELSRFNLRIALVEKESFPGFGVTKSGLAQIHAPDFCPEGSLKGKLCLNAAQRYHALAAELELTFRDVDELWLALEPSHVANLEAAKKRGEGFGATGFEIIGPERIRELEPHLNPNAVAALYVRGLGVLYPPEWSFALMENAVSNGVQYFPETAVTSITGNDRDGFSVTTSNGVLRARRIVNAAGLYADDIAAMVGDTHVKLVLTKGVMAIFDKSVGHLTRHMIYGTFSGKHSQVIAPTAHGNLILGLGTFTEPTDKKDTALPPGKLREVMAMGRELIPELSERDIITSFAGLRSENTVVPNSDFYIDHSPACPGVIHAVIGSPGLTAAPAIAEMIVSMISDLGARMEENKNFSPRRPLWEHFANADHEKRERLVNDNREFGRIVCRCETVSEAEIKAAIGRGAVTMDSVKNLTRAGMGRCQGGFCGSTVLNLLAQGTSRPVSDITKKGACSYILDPGQRCAKKPGEAQ